MRSPCATTRESPSVSEDPTQPNKQVSKIKKKKKESVPGPVPLGNPVTYFLDIIPKSGLTLSTYGSNDRDHQLTLPPRMHFALQIVAPSHLELPTPRLLSHTTDVTLGSPQVTLHTARREHLAMQPGCHLVANLQWPPLPKPPFLV